MYNSYKNDKPPADKSQLRILDYRNGKYQGTTIGTQLVREGVGIVLDHNYLLSIAAWKGGLVDGEVFIVFPDCTIFYGFLKNQLPVGMGCYQVPGKLQIHSLIGQSEEDLFALDDHPSRTLILLSIPRRIVVNLYEEPTVYEKMLKEENNHFRQSAKLNVKKEMTYANTKQKWTILQSFFKSSLSNELKDHKEFINHYFNKQVKSPQPKIQLSQNGQELQFNYANSSITCKMSYNYQNPFDFRVRFLGYYNHNDHLFEVAKKIQPKGDVIEEAIQNFKCQYPSKQRPSICMKHSQTYYRKSLHFINDFLEIDYLYRIKFIYHSVEVSIGEHTINKTAQKQLQTTVLAQQHQQKEVLVANVRKPPVITHVAHDQTYTKENLERIKDDLSKAIKNKSLGHSKSISNSKLQLLPPQKADLSRVVYPSYKQKQENEHQIRSISHYPDTSPGKRSYVYLQQGNKDRYKNHESPQRYEYTKDLNGRNASKSNGKLTKYKYVDESAASKKAENLAALTNYYREIESELRKEAPKATKRKHTNIDGTSNSRVDNKEDHFQRIQEKYQKSPLGTKRVFKYGWE